MALDSIRQDIAELKGNRSGTPKAPLAAARVEKQMATVGTLTTPAMPVQKVDFGAQNVQDWLTRSVQATPSLASSGDTGIVFDNAKPFLILGKKMNEETRQARVQAYDKFLKYGGKPKDMFPTSTPAFFVELENKTMDLKSRARKQKGD